MGQTDEQKKQRNARLKRQRRDETEEHAAEGRRKHDGLKCRARVEEGEEGESGQ